MITLKTIDAQIEAKLKEASSLLTLSSSALNLGNVTRFHELQRDALDANESAKRLMGHRDEWVRSRLAQRARV